MVVEDNKKMLALGPRAIKQLTGKRLIHKLNYNYCILYCYMLDGN